jgi:hypothetical protein
MQQSPSWQGRVKRLIASARLGLASISLLAIWLNPSEPSRYAQTAYTMLAEDEPWPHLASWSRDKFCVKPEPAATL